jgi:hypothetical protein
MDERTRRGFETFLHRSNQTLLINDFIRILSASEHIIRPQNLKRKINDNITRLREHRMPDLTPVNEEETERDNRSRREQTLVQYIKEVLRKNELLHNFISSNDINDIDGIVKNDESYKMLTDYIREHNSELGWNEDLTERILNTLESIRESAKSDEETHHQRSARSDGENRLEETKEEVSEETNEETREEIPPSTVTESNLAECIFNFADSNSFDIKEISGKTIHFYYSNKDGDQGKEYRKGRIKGDLSKNYKVNLPIGSEEETIYFLPSLDDEDYEIIGWKVQNADPESRADSNREGRKHFFVAPRGSEFTFFVRKKGLEQKDEQIRLQKEYESIRKEAEQLKEKFEKIKQNILIFEEKKIKPLNEKRLEFYKKDLERKEYYYLSLDISLKNIYNDLEKYNSSNQFEEKKNHLSVAKQSLEVGKDNLSNIIRLFEYMIKCSNAKIRIINDRPLSKERKKRNEKKLKDLSDLTLPPSETNSSQDKIEVRFTDKDYSKGLRRNRILSEIFVSGKQKDISDLNNEELKALLDLIKKSRKKDPKHEGQYDSLETTIRMSLENNSTTFK